MLFLLEFLVFPLLLSRLNFSRNELEREYSNLKAQWASSSQNDKERKIMRGYPFAFFFFLFEAVRCHLLSLDLTSVFMAEAG